MSKQLEPMVEKERGPSAGGLRVDLHIVQLWRGLPTSFLRFIGLQRRCLHFLLDSVLARRFCLATDRDADSVPASEPFDSVRWAQLEGQAHSVVLLVDIMSDRNCELNLAAVPSEELRVRVRCRVGGVGEIGPAAEAARAGARGPGGARALEYGLLPVELLKNFLLL